MKRGKKIITEFVYPPIPIRSADWSAVLDGYDAGDPIGRGPTETAAVADLLQQLDEREPVDFPTTPEAVAIAEREPCPLCGSPSK